MKEREATPGNQTNDIDVSSEFGLDGTVSITILEPGTIRGTTELPRNVIQAQQTTEQACSVNQETGKTNGLTVKGKGGVPPAPDLPLNADVLSIGGKIVANNSTSEQSPSIPLNNGEESGISAQINPESNQIKPIPTNNGDIFPARGVIKTEDGRIILTAYPTDNNQRTPHGSINCGKI